MFHGLLQIRLLNKTNASAKTQMDLNVDIESSLTRAVFFIRVQISPLEVGRVNQISLLIEANSSKLWKTKLREGNTTLDRETRTFIY